jgi:hypothetical protein
MTFPRPIGSTVYLDRGDDAWDAATVVGAFTDAFTGQQCYTLSKNWTPTHQFNIDARSVYETKEAWEKACCEPEPPPPADHSKIELSSGKPVPEDHSHTTLRPDGQQEGYIVLSPEERAKGYVRPIRDEYRHVGARPKNPTRPLTEEEEERYNSKGFNYVAYEEYPPETRKGSVVGRFWTAAQLNSGCGKTTTMGWSIAETYARDPKFYNGTFCCTCAKHFPLDEFVWLDGEQVGS